ncbi:MAG: hypothetical protein WCN92_09110, partial [Eubacteriales bacterium]
VAIKLGTKVLNDTYANKISWFTSYKKITMQLGYQTNETDPIKVEWLSDSAKLLVNKDTGYVTNVQTGTRSATITLKITDRYGLVVTDTVKITIYKFFWQI